MRELSILVRIQLLLIFLFFYQFSQAQITINSGPEVTPFDMVENFLGEGIQYMNVTYQGADIARGIFSNGDSTNLGIGTGIFLTSGSAEYIPGPNTLSSAGTNNGLPGYYLLTSITTAESTYDAAVLQFDFIPESDTIWFKYCFGSEEYNEYVGSLINDVCGCFVTGPNPDGGFYNNKNIAIVPGTVNTSVTINNVNNGWANPGDIPVGPCTNCAYFSDNTFGQTLEYDGFTTVLVAWLLVVPCEEYHMIIGVADAGGHARDSGIFLEENSITCPKIEVEAQLNPPGILNDMVEGFVEADIVFKLPNPDYTPMTVYFEVGGTANPAPYDPDGGDFEEGVPTDIDFEEGEDSAAFNVTPVYDGIIEGDETLELIVENSLGCIDRYDTVEFTILDYVEMVAQTSPNSMICVGQELDLWIQVYNGFPPYTYLWEPGGYTTDSITVSPEENTILVVTITDLFEETVQDSVQVIVFPVCDLETFYFEAYLNPGLLYDVFGNVIGDTVYVVFPPGTNLNGLIPSYTFSNQECSDTVGTVTDFSEPIVYQFFGPGGCTSEWIVIADVEVGQNERLKNEIQIFPNPTKDKIYINQAKGSILKIINNLGVKLYQKQITTPQFTVDAGNFECGIYYLQFKNEQQQFVTKIIIQQ